MDRKRTILVVDDIPENIDMLKAVLEDSYKIKAATNGKTALNIVKKTPSPDLILLDVMMPEMDGYEVCRHLKNDPLTADIPVIFVTAMREEEDERLGLEVGAVDYLTKPISPFITKARVDTHIRLYEKKQYLEELVKEETQKRMHNEKLLLRQSRLAAMGEIMSAITHQWSQPLSVIGTANTVLQIALAKGSCTQEKVGPQLEQIERTINFMRRTMDDFKSYFRVNKQRVLFPVKEAVDSLMIMLSPILENNNIDVEINIDENLYAYGVSGELKQVVLNLVSNAKDAIKERALKEEFFEGRITITGRKEGDKSIIEVLDNGGGIAQESIDKVFDDYYTTKQDKGMGIGLSMSRMIVQDQFYGDLKVENINDGAKFSLDVINSVYEPK